MRKGHCSTCHKKRVLYEPRRWHYPDKPGGFVSHQPHGWCGECLHLRFKADGTEWSPGEREELIRRGQERIAEAKRNHQSGWNHRNYPSGA